MKKMLLMLFALVFMLAGESAVSACVCGLLKDPTPAQVREQFIEEMQKAKVIFSGEVLFRDKYTVLFQVSKVWKGAPARALILHTGTKNNGDGTITTSSCDYRFALGEKYLVYAREEEGGDGALITYQCTGTDVLEDSTERVRFLDEAQAAAKGSASAGGAKSNYTINPTRAHEAS